MLITVLFWKKKCILTLSLSEVSDASWEAMTFTEMPLADTLSVIVSRSDTREHNHTAPQHALIQCFKAVSHRPAWADERLI